MTTMQKAREIVILAGIKLVESGLIARTWGNVSCRISDTHFVITPSGRDYLSLVPEEIVEVSIADCSYSGTIKPSSEKGIHAEVYKLHPEINFVIHTHQDQASAVSALMQDSIHVPPDFASLHGEVQCAAYGLPGTKKLRRNVAEALACSKGNAVIMKNHGALCYGIDYEEAFKTAHELEDACKRYILEQSLTTGNRSSMDSIKTGCFALSKFTGKTIMEDRFRTLSHCESERTGNGFRLQIADKSFDVVCDRMESVSASDVSALEEIKIHNEIYKRHPNINYILHAGLPGIVSVSCAGLKLLPLLDDFAQIAGTSVKTVEPDAARVSSALKRASMVFIQSNGALCCGGTKGDALAVSMVGEKNCNALISAALFGKIRYINHWECMLMRFVYLKKYSKLVSK